MQDPRRWRRLEAFSTSVATDRSSDEDAEGEQPYVTFENLHARPRAWITEEIIPLSEEDQLRAAHYGYLPNGQRFDPARTTMVDSLDRMRWQSGPASVRVLNARDGFFSLDVLTANGGFLVLSEGWYPSWQAHVDGRRVRVYRADVSLQGVVVPAGRHAVTFELISRAFQAGSLISALTLIALAVIGWHGMRRPPSSRRGLGPADCARAPDVKIGAEELRRS
jgi:hypothetical protein